MAPGRAACNFRAAPVTQGRMQGGPDLRWYKLHQEDAVDQAGPVGRVAVDRRDRTGNLGTEGQGAVRGMGAHLERGRREKMKPAVSKNAWFLPDASPRL